MKTSHRHVAAATALILSTGLAGMGPASASTPKRDQMILHLAPAARVEQRCNARAMGVISREHHDMRPDELVAYAFADTKVGADNIVAPGAAVRSSGHWYRLSYRCRTSADGMDIKEFSYVLGHEVPRADWSAHYLVP
ncbi:MULTISPECIES: DUF930 domain-containing protein [unclassified Xanthobacter]|uniref:DUF930 domain-containing protein n=1 Tax=unclassified Xanthobacter TaxID=2623496 RepID=UPI001F4510CB|nr:MULTISPECIES: DUF930 domain-containing protein [unclassified Xanthobacter]